MKPLKKIKRAETKKRVNLRLEPSLVAALRAEAARKGVAYQKLIRDQLWLCVHKSAKLTGGE